MHWKPLVLRATNAKDAHCVETVQSLWSGYGEIFRIQLEPVELGSLIVKQVEPPQKQSHPRGWNTDNSAKRKLRSYDIETHWYQQWSSQCHSGCRVPHCIAAEKTVGRTVLVLEDLDAAGYPGRHSSLTLQQAKPCLHWLAQFHANFLMAKPDGLWDVGTYWHLDTRPDEWQSMDAGPLKDKAQPLDQLLSQCRYKTLVHGDAKVANFCFSKDDQQVAAVDFQYVGGGCGMKDVAYFFGSCFNEAQCQKQVPELLDYYFDILCSNISHTSVDPAELEQEWRSLFAPAWTDFYRFLAGWMPQHGKIHGYTRALASETLKTL